MISILLIEDEQPSIDAVKLIIKNNFEDYIITVSKTLKDALLLISCENFDIIICDLCLPDSYGMNTLRLVHDASYGIPIIVCSGTMEISRWDKEISDLYENGASAFYKKGEDIKAIPMLINEEISKSNFRRGYTARKREVAKKILHQLEYGGMG